MLLYPSLKKLMLSMLLSLLGSVIPQVGGLLGLAGFVVMLLALREMRDLGERMQTAYRMLALSIWLMLGSIFVLAIGTFTPAIGLILVLGGIAILLAGCVCSVYSNYSLYNGLDELVVTHPYEYPPKKILWCFWLSVINLIFSMAISMILSAISQLQINQFSIPIGLDYLSTGIGLLVSLLQLALVFEFSQAVRRDEGFEKF